MRVKRQILARTRTWKRFFIRVLVVLLVFSLLGFLYAVFNSDLLRVKNLACFIGEERCSQELWAGIFNLVSGKPIISLSENLLEKKIKDKYPQFEGAEIKLKSFNSLIIRLEEKQPFALFNFESQPEMAWLVDRTGIVLGETTGGAGFPEVSVKNLGEIKISEGIDLRQSSLESALEILGILPEKGIEIKTALIEKEKDKMEIRASGWSALFSLNKDGKTQVDSLQLILSRAKIEGTLPGLIDLRFEKPVISFIQN
jgi:hypothetical protein